MYAPYLTFYSPPEAVFHDTGNAINYSASPAYLLHPPPFCPFAFLLVSSSPFFHPSRSCLTSPRLFGARVRKCWRVEKQVARFRLTKRCWSILFRFTGQVDLIISNVRFWYWNRNALFRCFARWWWWRRWGGSISPIVIIASRGRTQWRSRFSNGLIIIGCVWRGKKMAWRQEMDTALIQRCCSVCR